jgi:hypothetical protein
MSRSSPFDRLPFEHPRRLSAYSRPNKWPMKRSVYRTEAPS